MSGLITKSELKELLKREPVKAAIREFEMDGVFDIQVFADAIIQARNDWRAEQWPPGVQVS